MLTLIFSHIVLLLADTPPSVCGSDGSQCGLPFNQNLSLGTGSALFTNVFAVLFTVIGSLSVIFLIVGGLRYALSGGDPKNVKQAKETIIYAIIGLGISLVAVVIVSLVSTVAGGGHIK